MNSTEMNTIDYPASFAQEALNSMYEQETENTGEKDPLKPLLQEICIHEKHSAADFFVRLKELYNACLDRLENSYMDYADAAREDDRFFTVVSLMNYYEAAASCTC